MDNLISRRPFLQSSAVAVLTAGIANQIHAQPADDRFGKWPIGIQSYSLRKFNVDQALRHVQALGLRHIECFGGHYPIASTADDIVAMNRSLEQAGVQINAHGVNAFSKNHDANKKVFEFARRAGFKNITANPKPDSFDSLDELVEEYEVRICIHNHGPGALYDKLTDVQRAVKDRHPLIGVCIDTGHVLRSAEDPVDWVAGLGKRVFALHLKDVAEKQKKTHDVVLGSGHLRMKDLFGALGAVEFPDDGSMSIEYESSPDNPIDDIRQCLDIVEETVAATG